MLLTKPVRVAKTGNSRALPVPADAVRALDVQIGDCFTVEVRADELIYHRARANESTVTGSGGGRVAIMRPERSLPITGRSAVPPLDDWDF